MMAISVLSGSYGKSMSDCRGMPSHVINDIHQNQYHSHQSNTQGVCSSVVQQQPLEVQREELLGEQMEGLLLVVPLEGQPLVVQLLREVQREVQHTTGGGVVGGMVIAGEESSPLPPPPPHAATKPIAITKLICLIIVLSFFVSYCSFAAATVGNTFAPPRHCGTSSYGNFFTSPIALVTINVSPTCAPGFRSWSN